MKSVNFSPRFYVAAVMLAVILLIAIVGPIIVQTDPNATVGGLYDKPAGWGPLLLGTDNEGQSVIANLVYGTRTSLIVGLIAGTVATVIGLALGLIAGFKGGLIDNILSSVTNIFLVIPVIIVIILISVALMVFVYIYCRIKGWGKNDGDGRLGRLARGGRWWPR
jgi:peptide/nickel transport system permease protein